MYLSVYNVIVRLFSCVVKRGPVGQAWLGKLSWQRLWGEYHEESRKDSRVSSLLGIKKEKLVGTPEAGWMTSTRYGNDLGGMNKRRSVGVGKF